ncbi:MAG: hypothetical protein GY762_00675, partial [Proteobacteria bacterium]|nr:hypothetical protein [Pseudomonadota bacterium]
MAGAFATTSGLVRIDNTLTGLALSAFDTQVPLVPHEDGWLSLGEPGMCPQGICRIRVQRINDERTLAFEYQGGGRETVGVEYALPQNVAPEWQRRVGTYRFLNPEDCYFYDSSARIYIALDQDTGVLEIHTINLSDNNHPLLAPMAENMALRLARGRSMNETYSFYEVDGRIEYEASGTRFRKTDLQDTLDEMAADGDSEIDAASGMLADDRDSRWMLASEGQHDVMLLFDSYGLIGDYEFGIYQGDTYVPFAALNSSEKRQTLFDILADGSVTIGGEDTGVDMTGTHFGFYMKLKGQPPIHSDSLLNAEGKDHMRAYQGKGERIDMSSILGSDMPTITWGTDQYLLAWDIGIGDD